MLARMQRKPGFPVTSCSIKMPEPGNSAGSEPVQPEEEADQHQRRQQLINFGHSQWGFNNWSWTVTKQELDFVDFTNGKFCAGVVAFVSVVVKSFDIHRENIGYATSVASTKGMAIYKSRKEVKPSEASEEEARAERKRRQRQAQEEFRQRQLLKQKAGLDEKQEVQRNSSSFDNLLMEIPTQDIEIDETGNTPAETGKTPAETGKRKSPAPETNAKRRNSLINKLDVVHK